MKIHLLLLALFCSAAVVSGESTKLSPQLDHLREEGFHALYNMDYEKASAKFAEMCKTDPQHPAGYIYQASTIWLNYLASLRRLQTGLYTRSNAFFGAAPDKPDPEVEKKFKEMISIGIRLAEQRIKQDQNDAYALYYLGVAKGAIAGYETTVKRSFLSSLRNGSEAVKIHRTVVKKDPELIDAFLSIGMYDYVVGSLPLSVKILAFLGGVHGSKKNGISQLEKVYEKGHYAKDEAAVILVLLYDREKQFADALKVLKGMSARYPDNFLFRLEIGSTLARLNRLEESFNTFHALLDDKSAMDYMPDFIHYAFADALFDAHRWEEASHHYISAAGYPRAPQGMATVAKLKAGFCFDAAGKRALAEAQYAEVLARPEVLDSHDLAKKYQKKPFTP